jgi:putative selenate reductase FAD-binding subunit
MNPLVYERPENMKKALKAIQDGTPLGGGTRISARRQSGEKYVDLQDLGLDKVNEHDQGWNLGAMVRVQTLIDSEEMWPKTLTLAARREAGWNIRNQASLGGLVMAADGRSPLLTCLLAAGAQAHVEPGAQQMELHELLAQRDELEGVLLTELMLPKLTGLAYEQVARSPADRPIVCAAAAKTTGDEPLWRLAIGGYGTSPVLVDQGAYDVDSFVQKATEAYDSAGDDWASSEYRIEIVSVLARRVLGEVK